MLSVGFGNSHQRNLAMHMSSPSFAGPGLTPVILDLSFDPQELAMAQGVFTDWSMGGPGGGPMMTIDQGHPPAGTSSGTSAASSSSSTTMQVITTYHPLRRT